MMFLKTVETAFARYQAKGEAAALAIVFDRTAPELLRLARHLAGETAAAEDLVQATFVTAIESAQDHERGLAVLPWLCGILANHARSHRRQARRTPDPNRMRGDDVVDAHAEAAGRELEQEVRDAIAQLPEVYRPVLRLWLEHGLEAHEIAATLERPAGTVRAQVSRGMEQLRRALPAGLASGAAVSLAMPASAGRGLAAVRSEVLGACAGTSSGLASTLVLGGLMMLHHKLVLAATAALLALLTWFAWPPAPTPLADASSLAQNASTLASGSGPQRTGDQQPGDEAARKQRTPAAIAAATDPATSPETTPSLLRIELRDALDGRILPGYGVSVQRAEALQDFGDLPNYVQTDSAGIAQFADLSAGRWLVSVDRVGFVVAVQQQHGETVHKVVRLQPKGKIHGTVLARDGQPVANAAVHALDNGVRPPELVRTDRLGRFVIEHASQLVLQARHANHAPSWSHQVTTTPGSETKLTLQLLKAGRTITGVVHDEQGQPLANTAVAILPDAAKTAHPLERDKPAPRAHWLRTDEEGRFRTIEVGAGKHLVLAVPNKRSQTPIGKTVDTTQQDAFAELRVPAPSVLEGRMVQGGKPAAGMRITVFPEQPTDQFGYLMNIVGLRTATTAADGTFSVRGVLPGKLLLQAMKGMTKVAQTRIDLRAGETQTWQHDIRGTQQLRIQVVADANSTLPQPLFALAYQKTAGNVPAMQMLNQKGQATIELAATERIDVVLALLGGSSYIGLARIEGVAAGPEVLRFELHRDQLPSTSIRGRLIDNLQAPLSAQTVRAQRIDAPGLTVNVESTTGNDGTFSIGPLPAGTYSLMCGSVANGSGREAARLCEVTVTSAGDERIGDVTKPGR